MLSLWILFIVYLGSAIFNGVIILDSLPEDKELHSGHGIAIFYPVINTITALIIIIELIRDKNKARGK